MIFFTFQLSPTVEHNQGCSLFAWVEDITWCHVLTLFFGNFLFLFQNLRTFIPVWALRSEEAFPLSWVAKGGAVPKKGNNQKFILLIVYDLVSTTWIFTFGNFADELACLGISCSLTGGSKSL